MLKHCLLAAVPVLLMFGPCPGRIPAASEPATTAAAKVREVDEQLVRKLIDEYFQKKDETAKKTKADEELVKSVIDEYLKKKDESDRAAKAAQQSPAGTPEGPSCQTCKEVLPTPAKKKYFRYCYNWKEVDFVPTKFAWIPVPTTACPSGKCCPPHGLLGLRTNQPAACLGCNKCGKPTTYHVLIKTIIEEEIDVPGCKVERSAIESGCPGGACPAARALPIPAK